jgi:hypothetical protein
MRTIDADKLVDMLYDNEFAVLCPLDEVSGVVDACPTVDAVVVTRCEDCKHLVAVNVNGKGIPTCRMSGMEVAPAEFCSRGEKERRC